MKQIIARGAVIGALAFAASAQAAPTLGLTGTITFNGTVTNDSCIMSIGSQTSTTSYDMTVPMGQIPVSSLGAEDTPATGSGLPNPGEGFTVNLQCAAGTTYTLKLSRQATPMGGGGKGLGLNSGAGAAQYVQVVLQDANSGNILNFSTGSAEVVIPTGTPGASASYSFIAYYARTNGGTTPVAGTAVAVANYELSYE